MASHVNDVTLKARKLHHHQGRHLEQGAAKVPGSVRFGSNSNQTSHAFRHVVEAGMDSQAVENAIRGDLGKIGDISGQYSGTVAVQGRSLIYSAFGLPDGTVNVGRIVISK
jgi:hypothetical protein